MESRLFATFTVPAGEMHEDFKTLKAEIQRETQEVEKLSPVGQSSLLTALCKLLGKKKELQDLELTVRSQWKWRRRGGLGEGRFLVQLHLWGVWGALTLAKVIRGQGTPQRMPSPSWPCAPGCPGASGEGQTVQFPRHTLLPDGQGRQQASRALSWKGTGTFLSRKQGSGTKEPPSPIFSGLDTLKEKSGNSRKLKHVKGLCARHRAGPLPRVVLVTHLSHSLKGLSTKDMK